MSKRIDVLDHGYMSVVDSWGSDEKIIEAARMSTDKGFEGWGPRHKQGCEYAAQRASAMSAGLAGVDDSFKCGCNVPGDEKLLRYLWTHKHATPFEMAGVTIEVQAPIFVFREWQRHRTQSYNEMSARYTKMPNIHYVPSVERIIESGNQTSNRQSSGSGKRITKTAAKNIQLSISCMQKDIYTQYEALINECGLSKEIARINTPVSRYSRMRAQANLRNWLAFLTLRMDEAAQWEIRQYANVLHSILANLFPRTIELFDAEPERQ